MQAARGTSISSTPRQTTHGRSRFRLLFALVAVVGVSLDVVTKRIAVASLQPDVGQPVVDGLLTLRLIRNSGAAFSVGQNFTFVFALLSFAVLGYVVVRLVPRIGHPGWAVALGLLSAGVAGNLCDRLFRAPGFLRGHVVDFLQLPRWPIFNVADMCITTAAVLIMVLSVAKGVGLGGERYQRQVKNTGHRPARTGSAPGPQVPPTGD